MMSFLKTKYYPVCLDTRTILNEPHKREREIAWKYRTINPGLIGLKGSRLNSKACYQKFVVVEEKI